MLSDLVSYLVDKPRQNPDHVINSQQQRHHCQASFTRIVMYGICDRFVTMPPLLRVKQLSLLKITQMNNH